MRCGIQRTVLFVFLCTGIVQSAVGQQQMREFVQSELFKRVVANSLAKADPVQSYLLVRGNLALGGALPADLTKFPLTDFASNELYVTLISDNRVSDAKKFASLRNLESGNSRLGYFGLRRFLSREQLETFVTPPNKEKATEAQPDVANILCTLFFYQQFRGDKNWCRSLMLPPSALDSNVKSVLLDENANETVKVDCLLALCCSVDVHSPSVSKVVRREAQHLLSSNELISSVYYRCLELKWYRLAGELFPLLNQDRSGTAQYCVIALANVQAFESWFAGCCESPFSDKKESWPSEDIRLLHELMTETGCDAISKTPKLKKLIRSMGGLSCVQLYLRTLLEEGTSHELSVALDAVRDATTETDSEKEGEEYSLDDRVDLQILICVCLRSLGRDEEANNSLGSLVEEVLESDVVFDDFPPKQVPTLIRLVEFGLPNDALIDSLSSACTRRLFDEDFVHKNGASFLESLGYLWARSTRNSRVLEYISKHPHLSSSFCTGVGRQLASSNNLNAELELLRLLDDKSLLDDPFSAAAFVDGIYTQVRE